MGFQELIQGPEVDDWTRSSRLFLGIKKILLKKPGRADGGMSFEAVLTNRESIYSWRISNLAGLTEDVITGVKEERDGASRKPADIPPKPGTLSHPPNHLSN